MSGSIPAARLSCEQCSQRKTKCDKNLPCSACLKAGLGCIAVHRQRLPRGRSGHTRRRDGLLKARIDRLEALVARIDAQGTVPAPADGIVEQPRDSTISDQALQPASPYASPESRASPINNYVASSFWQDLSAEVYGLRGVLGEPDVEEMSDQLATSDVSDPSVNSADAGASLMFGSSGNPGSTTSLERPSPDMRKTLLNVFFERVDSIFKVVHRPTVMAMLGPGTESGVLSPADEALEFSIYFTAACALTSQEIGDCELMMHRYRDMAETALSRAGLLTSQNVTVVQAFALYIAGLRTTNNNAAPWALVALLIRLAEAQGLNLDAPNSRPPFQEEMRRRLWCSIGILDVQSAFDRGTKLLLKDDVNPTLPLNINDEDISPSSTAFPLPSPTVQCADMLISSMTQHAMVCERRLANAGMTPDDVGKSASEVWNKKLSIVATFEEYIHQVTAVCVVDSTPFTRFTLTCGRGCLVTMQLLMRRPLQKQEHAKPPSDDDFDPLQVATEVLERSVAKYMAEFWQWQWFKWVKWYALAIVLAELCAKPDTPGWERAWSVAKGSFESYAEDVADSDSGLLWKPIKRLMQKAQERMRSIEKQTIEPTFGTLPSAISGPLLTEAPGDGAYGRGLNMAGGMAPAPSWEAFGGDAMSWVNWESFIDDIGNQGEVWGSFADPSFAVQ